MIKLEHFVDQFKHLHDFFFFWNEWNTLSGKVLFSKYMKWKSENLVLQWRFLESKWKHFLWNIFFLWNECNTFKERLLLRIYHMKVWGLIFHFSHVNFGEHNNYGILFLLKWMESFMRRGFVYSKHIVLSESFIFYFYIKKWETLVNSRSRYIVYRYRSKVFCNILPNFPVSAMFCGSTGHSSLHISFLLLLGALSVLIIEN